MIALEEPERQVHGQHEKLAVGKIDDSDHAEDECEPDAEECIDTPKQKS